MWVVVGFRLPKIKEDFFFGVSLFLFLDESFCSYSYLDIGLQKIQTVFHACKTTRNVSCLTFKVMTEYRKTSHFPENVFHQNRAIN